MEWKLHVIFFLVAGSIVQCAEEHPPEKAQPSSEAVPETGSEPSDSAAPAGTSPSADEGSHGGQLPTSQTPTGGDPEPSGATAPNEGEGRSQDSSDEDEDTQPTTSRAVTGYSPATTEGLMNFDWLMALDDEFLDDSTSDSSSSSSSSISSSSSSGRDGSDSGEKQKPSTLQAGSGSSSDSDTEEVSQPSTSQAETQGASGPSRAAARARSRRLCKTAAVRALVGEIKNLILTKVNNPASPSPLSLLKMASRAGYAQHVHSQACEILTAPREKGHHTPFYEHPIYRQLLRATNYLSMVQAAHPETTEPVQRLIEILHRVRRRLVKHLSV